MPPITLARRAILFDLDGVLVDSEEVVARTWMRWAARTGIDIPDLLNRVQGRRSIDSVRDLAPQLDVEHESRWLADAESVDGDGLRVMPGALQLFTALSERQRAIVTSCDRVLATFRLKSVGLPIPAQLVTADDVREGKPSPIGYREGGRRLGVAASDCVVIEDAPAGIRAGRAAGATVIGVRTTFPSEALHEAHIIVSSLEHVTVQAASDGSILVVIGESIGGTGVD